MTAPPTPVRPVVLYVMPGRPEGHNMVFARRSAAALRERGFDVPEFYLASRTQPLEVFREWRRLRRVVRELDPAIVHAQYGSATGLVALLGAGHRPLVLTVRGSDLNRVASIAAWRNAGARVMTRFVAKRARAVVCVSAGLAQQLRGACARAAVIPSGVDTAVFRPADIRSARAALGWDPHEHAVLFYAGTAPRLKGLALVEAAMVLVARGGVPARLVTLLGERSHEEVAAAMNAADCLVLASESEGSPNVVKEAMACALPVVSVAVGDAAERLRGVAPGAIVERTPGAIAEGIVRVLAAPRRSNGPAALAAQGLSIGQTMSALCGVYRGVLDAQVDAPPTR